MVLVLNGVLQEDCPLDSHSLYQSHPIYRETAAQFLAIPTKIIGPEGLVYIQQREFAATVPHDKCVSILGADDVTTCIIVVLRHSGSGAVALAHMDVLGIDEAVCNMVQKIQELTMGYPEGRIELQLIGGYNNLRPYTKQIFLNIMTSFHKLSIEVDLTLACVGELNTTVRSGIHWPIIFGIGVDVKTGEIYSAKFPDKGPDQPLRWARYLTGHRQVLDIYDSTLGLLSIGPFNYEPLRGVELWLQQSDDFILQQLSTAPEVEPTHFVVQGRFVVSIPFKTSPTVLGDSEFVAKKRFLALERRLQANPKLQTRYLSFMQEYRDLNHMTLVMPNSEISYYLPHHGVLKEDSLTTKLRVVFNGSSATTTGHSLNSIQMIGPTMQQDLFTILLKFRQHLYALAADIEKMYRQVQIDPGQRHLQRILWRFSPEEPIETYDLNTVTYGTASASYLAIRSLFQLGINCDKTSPVISKIIKYDFYVDDLLSGADSVDEARLICSELISVLNSGCFNLRKWISNDPRVLENVPKADIHPGILNFGDQEHAKTLGLIWIYQTDHFMFNIAELSSDRITKRTMLSEISQIFDPLGLLSPCTFTAKVFMQSLWLEKLDWDDSVPKELEKKWISYRNDLITLNDLKIPCHVTCVDPVEIQIHGFCDASQVGYGACVYFRVTDSNDVVRINLLCSKSRVAPLKPTTIPRLELSGAVLLSKLVKQVKKSLKFNVAKYVFWTDSTIVLGWLKTTPNLLKTFVCNRVADIQEHSSYADWRHVSTKFNPADLLSRGVTPQVLKTATLWWNGPPWLLEEEASWPNSRFPTIVLPEFKNETQALIVNEGISFPYEDYSNASRLERIIAYCLRFRSNCFLHKKERKTGPLSPDELAKSMKTLIKLSQLDSFKEEHKQLSKGNSLKDSSPLLAFNPFLDNDNLIRVGGRLRNTEYSFNKKHPFLLSGKHFFAKLIVRREHLRLLHAGPQLLLCSLRDKFWITSGRNLTKKIVHECVRCFRALPSVTRPIMGNLPSERATPSHPFHITGIDYAGPIPYKLTNGRGSRLGKAYLCLFVCFASKAVHIELVTSLSTDAFLFTLRRFIARRGKPLHIHSDNGTNFVGANSKLHELGKLLKDHESFISDALSNQGINWHFIPAHSPHFGGLWESGIKS